VFAFARNVVLITGAAQGLGRVCALAFATRGAKLALCDINDDGGQETLRQAGLDDMSAYAERAGSPLNPRERRRKPAT
jgi:NAD(P)-dependent dehydrogenase (short-subunit alcohol dehydrogenase family)